MQPQAQLVAPDRMCPLRILLGLLQLHLLMLFGSFRAGYASSTPFSSQRGQGGSCPFQRLSAFVPQPWGAHSAPLHFPAAAPQEVVGARASPRRPMDKIPAAAAAPRSLRTTTINVQSVRLGIKAVQVLGSRPC
jgi:hypothetical protein